MNIRCVFGWHGAPLMERTTDPYRVQWRCERCWKVIGDTVARPSVTVKKLKANVVPIRKRA